MEVIENIDVKRKVVEDTVRGERRIISDFMTYFPNDMRPRATRRNEARKLYREYADKR